MGIKNSYTITEMKTMRKACTENQRIPRQIMATAFKILVSVSFYVVKKCLTPPKKTVNWKTLTL
jgi:hypothetical protein